MAMGFITLQVVSFCFAISLASQAWNAPPTKSVGIFWCMQIFILFGYGIVRLAQSISNEKVERTWDFIRLTPLSSKQVVLGKFLGAPLYAYFLFACLLPWTATYFFFLEPTDMTQYRWIIAISLGGVFLAFQFALLLSAYTEMKKRRASGSLGIAFLTMIFTPWASALIMKTTNSSSSIIFYAVEFDVKTFLLASFFIFGIWAFFGSCWRVGADLLEPPRVWRLPAFLFFLSFYIAGIGTDNAWNLHRANSANTPFAQDPSIFALISVIIFAYTAAFLNSSKMNDWKEIFDRWKNMDQLHHLPKWVIALICTYLIALMLWMKVPSDSIYFRVFLLMPLFLTRDFLFLQFCRFTSSRKPDVMAAIYLALAYGLPSIVITSFKIDAFFYFLPVSSVTGSFVFNFVPVVVQIIALLGLVVAQWKNRTTT
jgi:hypothetical protein